MKRVKIGYLKEEEKRYQAQVEQKANHFKNALDYCNGFCNVRDLEAFADNMVKYFTELFVETYKNDFPSIVGTEKRFELAGFSLSKLRAFQDAFDRIPHELDLITLEPKEKKDFAIYTETEEEYQRYKTLQTICTAIAEAHSDKVCNVFPAQIVGGLGYAVQFDFASQTLIPNVAWVKGNIR